MSENNRLSVEVELVEILNNVESMETGEICAVCLEPIPDMFKILACNHKFHIKCLEGINICPLCRNEVGGKICNQCLEMVQNDCHPCKIEKLEKKLRKNKEILFFLYNAIISFIDQLDNIFHRGQTNLYTSIDVLENLFTEIRKFKSFLKVLVIE